MDKQQDRIARAGQSFCRSEITTRALTVLVAAIAFPSCNKKDDANEYASNECDQVFAECDDNIARACVNYGVTVGNKPLLLLNEFNCGDASACEVVRDAESGADRAVCVVAGAVDGPQECSGDRAYSYCRGRHIVACGWGKELQVPFHDQCGASEYCTESAQLHGMTQESPRTFCALAPERDERCGFNESDFENTMRTSFCDGDTIVECLEGFPTLNGSVQPRVCGPGLCKYDPDEQIAFCVVDATPDPRCEERTGTSAADCSSESGSNCQLARGTSSYCDGDTYVFCTGPYVQYRMPCDRCIDSPSGADCADPISGDIPNSAAP